MYDFTYQILFFRLILPFVGFIARQGVLVNMSLPRRAMEQMGFSICCLSCDAPDIAGSQRCKLCISSHVKVRDKISCLVKHRIKEIDKHKVCAKDVLGQALLPYNTPTFMHQLWDTADNMWIGIGDKTPHSDTNYYTKRIILCGVIASSIMFWVSDKGNEVDEFIDRRIDDALKLGKIKKPESLKILKQFSKFMPHINHPLKMRD